MKNGMTPHLYGWWTEIMSSSLIRYHQRRHVKPETERVIVSRVYAFVLEKHYEKKAAESAGGVNDGKGTEHAPANGIVPARR
jgi:hypothetical protein